VSSQQGSGLAFSGSVALGFGCLFSGFLHVGYIDVKSARQFVITNSSHVEFISAHFLIQAPVGSGAAIAAVVRGDITRMLQTTKLAT